MKIIHIVTTFFLIFTVESKSLKKVEICIKKNETNSQDALKVSDQELFNNIVQKFNIPSNLSINFNNDVIQGLVNITNLDLKFAKIDFCLSKELINISNITIKAEEYYIPKANIADLFLLYGKGSLEIDVESISLDITSILPKLDFKCFLIGIGMDLKNMKANLTNLMNGDDILCSLFNKVIGDLGPDFIEYSWPFLNDKVVYILQKIVDHYEKMPGLTDTKEKCYTITGDVPKGFNI